ncbi:Transmembrane protein of unknown function (DUF3556) [Saccharomonospora marina XMU15]|uniref:Transmembrane protein n=1 Tax=Saccharomonospora marina XMU15 TaxID=882083 RepID=H5WYM6_9PSEU|nr:DUF3556 domain-containing protein [Saccharomonospora marina]EHR50691.1 Transmembrane protein of unknown function (DUF3556) [Saccharomonospora marina XMU15]
MGFKTPDMPPVDPAKFESMPVMERMRMLAVHWTEYGFGGPKQMHMLYLIKTVLFVVGGWLVVGLTTPGLSLTDLGAWWGELIVYQKLMVWTVLWEITGHAASWGPLAFKFGPMIGGWRYWARPGTLRLPPYPGKVPGTAGDRRSAFDVGLYLLIVANLLFLLLSPGVQNAAAYTDVGLLPGWALLSYVALLLIMGLRDRVVFLASRPEQYAVCLLAFGVLASHVDMVLVAKIAMVVIWLGAGVSKFGHHFSLVVQAMMSNTPWLRSKRFKRSLYRNVPTDLRPSKMALGWAHLGGTVVELCLPLVLLFSTNATITWLAIAGMVLFHLFIYSTFPLAVPLEWNVFFIFVVPFLFGGFFAGNGYSVVDFSSAWILAAALILCLTGPILGNLRPEWVSFLISMRQYAGNWASATMAFRMNDAEDKLDTGLVKSMKTQRQQLLSLYGSDVAEIFLQKCVAFRSMHSHGRMHLSLLQRHLDKLENYRLREGEVVCTVLVGWQFGDGHLFDERTIAAVQQRCGFEPGEFVMAWTESQPIHKKTVRYMVVDAALGVVERGYYDVRDAVAEQPWIPNGPVPHQVTWRLPGYEPAGDFVHPAPRPADSARPARHRDPASGTVGS